MKVKPSNQKPSKSTPLPPADPVRIYLHKSEIAKRLGVAPRTVAVWALQGKIPAYRFGKFLRFKWDEVEQALAASFRVTPTPGGAQ